MKRKQLAKPSFFIFALLKRPMDFGIHPDLKPYVERYAGHRRLALGVGAGVLVAVIAAQAVYREGFEFGVIDLFLLFYVYLLCGLWPHRKYRTANQALREQVGEKARIKMYLLEVDGGFDYMVDVIPVALPSALPQRLRIEPPVDSAAPLDSITEGTVFRSAGSEGIVAIRAGQLLFIPE
jgi:hypothetical protein